jgi:hypothetical protein
MKRNMPMWLKARYGGKCSNPKCGRGIKKGEEILYYPASKRVLCCYEPCGQRAWRELETVRAQERLEFQPR